MKHMQEVLDEELSGESEHQKHSMHRQSWAGGPSDT